MTEQDRRLVPVTAYSPGVGRFVAMLEETRWRLLRDLEDFDEAFLDGGLPWSPNAIGTLLYHVAAIELDWTFADILETDVFPEGVEDWFPVDVREDDGRLTPVIEPLHRHLERLAWVRGHLLEALRGLDDQDLDRVVSAGTPSEGTIGWVLQHLMQHEAEHRGQMGEIRVALSSR